MNLEEYMNKSLEDRRSHLDLSSDCREVGGNSSVFRGILSITLNTTMNYSLAYCCHACNNDKCSNPKHLYWGTPKNNVMDCREVGRLKSFHQKCVDKFGETEYKVMEIIERLNIVISKIVQSDCWLKIKGIKFEKNAFKELKRKISGFDFTIAYFDGYDEDELSLFIEVDLKEWAKPTVKGIAKDSRFGCISGQILNKLKLDKSVQYILITK